MTDLVQHANSPGTVGTTLIGLQAQPVKVGQPLAIQPSNAPLTVPDAPRLALHERSASRQAFDAAVAEKQKQAEVSFITSLWDCCAPIASEMRPAKQMLFHCCVGHTAAAARTGCCVKHRLVCYLAKHPVLSQP